MNFDKWKLGSFSIERIVNKDIKLSKEELKDSQERVDYQKKFIGIGVDELNNYIKNNGISEEEILNLFSEKDFLLKKSLSINIWVNFIKDLENDTYSDEKLPRFKWSNGGKLKSETEIPFINFLEPFLKVAVGKFRSNINKIHSKYTHTLITEITEKQMIEKLLQELMRLSLRVLVLELNVQRVSETLKGETEAEKLSYYYNIVLNDKDYRKSVLSEYSVMFRIMVTKIDYWICNMSQVVENTLKDREELVKYFNDGKPIGELIKINMGLSDAHNKGKSVIHLVFDSGFNIIYKPRSLRIDDQFQKFLQWFNNSGVKKPLYITKLLDKEHYGWVEYIEYKTCIKESEINSYYWRLGTQLCILYLFRATDFHYENIIACKDQPVLIDLEALFHNVTLYDKEETAYDNVASIIEKSVIRVGILPIRSWGKNGVGGVDISGIGGQKNQTVGIKNPILENIDSTSMCFSYDYGKIIGSNNRPTLNNDEISTIEFKNIISEGFKETYNHLNHSKEELKKEILKFKDIEVRLIVRFTQKYASFLQISTHPDFLRSGLDREMLFNKLWNDTVAFPKLKDVIEFEKQDLLLGDIPYFKSTPNELDIYNNDGKCIKNFFKETSMDIVLNLIDNLSEKDCNLQCEFINTTMTSLDIEDVKNNKITKIKKLSNDEKKTLHDDYLTASVMLGEYLMSRAYYGLNENEEDISWISINVVGEKESEWSIAPISLNLYEGLAGVALYYAYLAKITNREDFLSIAKKSIIPIKRQLKIEKQFYKNSEIGAYSGDSSLIYTLLVLANMWNDKELLNETLDTLKYIERQIEYDENYDLMSGSAGCIIVLIKLYEQTGEKYALDLAIRCGEMLLKKAIDIEGGFGWQPKIASNALAGFSHGAAGISWALYKLGDISGMNKFTQAGHKALVFERSLFSKERGNWADKRAFKGVVNEDLVPLAWCHGAPGILLSRLLIRPYVNLKEERDYIDKEINVALNTTEKFGFGRSHCLCHGDLGNIEILNYASECLNRYELKDLTTNYSRIVVDDILNGKWQCGLPNQKEVPGVMLGISGIGLSLLKLYDPDLVPAITRLEGPELEKDFSDVK
ncbi:type 2 lantipeptide synthetase LanM family protein (plasmid) [Clostridium estertheticum]|uniref:Type 2 lantipeptide synthetase LanM family protein n=1 Tax=Clostridium estertheticum TaxID=238834 RepID=A0AA47EN90_9CLOT|nr:type 2 lanthipeptide synthetase LanM family protein [Clostridium estertheticum]MBU3157719.1 type 2 lantipeptide synthetase LanM family protein [Clostridium estertheticum]MBU3201976.1 type 2 lantipeptide synthetase LanM family protein [Clostridium estertheticum]WAG63347.1 type 2 lantipeptide synthetase LanM family protein [Clostridium estertheticum]WAG68217.1 type 2 lantipeptide synthetase LanM family protein [Clostridium estertheticum]